MAPLDSREVQPWHALLAALTTLSSSRSLARLRRVHVFMALQTAPSFTGYSCLLGVTA